MGITLDTAASLDAALKAASPGDTIEVNPGTYPGQTLTYDASMEDATAPVLVKASGAKLSGTLEVLGLQHVHIDGLELTGLWNIRPSTGNTNKPESKMPHHLTFTNMNVKTFLIRNLHDSVIRGCRIGGWDASLTPLGPPKLGAYPGQDGAPERLMTNVLIEDCLFHDMLRTIAGTAHAEGLYFDAGVDGFTLRGCTITNCAVFDIFSNGPIGSRPITNVLIENCLLDCSRNADGSAAGSTVNLKGGASNWTFRGNSILGQGGTLRNDSASYPGFVFERNAIENGSFGWIGPATWKDNVMAVPAPGQEQAKPVGFVSATLAPCDINACYRNDLHVTPDGPAGKAGAGVPIDGTVPDPPPLPEPDDLPLTELSPPGADPVVLGWAPVPSAIGYRFTRDGKYESHTWDGSRSQIRFSRGGELGVEAMLQGPSGDWPN